MLGSRIILSIVSMLLVAALVSGYCPNGCNGRGTCGANDRCTCYTRIDTNEPAYIGADCSHFTCPKGKAWVDTPTAQNTGHAQAECSSRGLCDRTTGNCKCFPGYDGRACDRTICPNACSGNGVCRMISQIATGYTTAWDSDKMMGCVCDSGFRGADCSLKECPSGTDVLGGKGKTAGRECGGRGLCNREKGTCECFHGYFGTICNQQTTVA